MWQDTMSDKSDGKNGNGSAQPAAPVQLHVKVVSQYLKDLSFENPNVQKLVTGPGDQPSLAVEVNVQAERLPNGMYESAIELKATATNKAIGTIYVLETVYAGIFQIDNAPEEALEPLLLISGPTTLFPFLRRIVADTTREGGFPPLYLDPIDFAQLYVRRQQLASAPAANA
jgi:preprotein translocase subunit SecB